MPAIVELSGGGAVSGTNYRDGMILAMEEINAKGGILGKKIDMPLLDSQSEAGIARSQVQKVLDNKPYRHHGPGVLRPGDDLDAAGAAGRNSADRRRRSPGGYAEAAIPTSSAPSFGAQFSMPKLANYMHDSVKAKSVAILWVNNDFGKGGRDAFVKEMGSAQHQGRGRHFDRSGTSRLFRRRGQAQRRRMPI